MDNISLEEAKTRLPELIGQLKPGESVDIREGEVTVATLTAARHPAVKRTAGACRSMVISYVEDDEHLKDFEEYM
jgi:antitoxin (DNA-binding transcriptional repressor) of toxin-antitoxin stability system